MATLAQGGGRSIAPVGDAAAYQGRCPPCPLPVPLRLAVRPRCRPDCPVQSKGRPSLWLRRPLKVASGVRCDYLAAPDTFFFCSSFAST